MIWFSSTTKAKNRDPAEGIHGELDSQPYPPMAAHEMKEEKKPGNSDHNPSEKPALESQPYPPVIPPHAEVKADDKIQTDKPSSQPYPPITGSEKPE